jgi:hypothetical protein
MYAFPRLDSSFPFTHSTLSGLLALNQSQRSRAWLGNSGNDQAERCQGGRL